MALPHYRPAALADLEDIYDHIAQDNPPRAWSFLEELREAGRRIAEHPRAGRARPELGRGIRSRAHGNYVIFYWVRNSRVEILRVIHGARDIPAIFGRR